MKAFEDVEGNEWRENLIGTFYCNNTNYRRPVTLHYLTSEFGPLKELEAV